MPKSAALLCAAIALANAGGWLFDLPVLISIRPSLPKMVPASAALVFLAAVSLACQARRRPLRFAALASGAAVALWASVMLLGHLTGLPVGPLLAGAFGSQGAGSLSSTFTSTMFAALGMALVLMVLRRWAVAAQALAMGAFLVSLLNASGYFFRDTFLYQVLPGQGVGILTTVAAMALAAGILFLRPRLGIMAAVTEGMPAIRIARRLLLAAIVVPLLLGIAVTLALDAGLYDPGTALPLLVWGTIVEFTVIIWRLCLQLYAVELARQRAETELRRTMQELHEADGRKDVFLATLAHELRNPLAPIKATAQLLGRVGAGDDEQLRPLVERRNHACRIDADAQPVWVLGDAKRLVQVLANLMNNAAKYTPPGGELRVTLRADARQARIAVQDNGAGIAPALLPRVFEMFTQAALTPERAEGGLGMGLALVKRLTEMQGGSVRADSAGAGRGSTFTVTLPLADPATAQPG